MLLKLAVTVKTEHLIWGVQCVKNKTGVACVFFEFFIYIERS